MEWMKQNHTHLPPTSPVDARLYIAGFGDRVQEFRRRKRPELEEQWHHAEGTIRLRLARAANGTLYA
jgi:hypothetical protein